MSNESNPFKTIREEWEAADQQAVDDWNNDHFNPRGIESRMSFIEFRRKQTSITLLQLLNALEKQHDAEPKP